MSSDETPSVTQDVPTGPYAIAAEKYWRAGWANALPIGDGNGRPGKSHPPRGYTGYEGRNVSWPDLSAWIGGSEGTLNLGVRMMSTVGIDVDAHDGERGAETLAKAEADLGPLPPTYSSTSRGPGASRILIYRIPFERERLLSRREAVLVDRYGPNIEILHRGHRFAVAWPSVHPDTGQTYQWYGPDGQLCVVPRREDVPELPPAWLDFLAPLEEVTEPVVPSMPALSPSQVAAPNSDRRSLQAAKDILAGALQKFTDPQADGRATRLLPALCLIAGHGIPGGFWTEQQAREGIEKAAIECGYVQKHGLADLRTQLDRGLAHGALTGWTLAAEPGQSPFETPAAVEGGGRLRRAMFTRSQIHSLPDPAPLIEGVLYRDSVTVLAGKFGTYKSFVAVAWAACLASGQEWEGHAVPQRVPVIYAAAEGAYGIRRRLDAWEQARDANGVSVHSSIPDDLYLISVSVRLNRIADVMELEELIRETGAKALIFDTLHASTPGVDENDAGEMGAVMDVLRELQRKHGIAAILPHHTGHGGERSRGSSSIEDDADTSFVIELQGEDRGPVTPRVMKHRKTKDAALQDPMVLKLNLTPGTGSGWVSVGNAFEAAAGQESPAQWVAEGGSMVDRIVTVLTDHAFDRGLTKSEAHGVVVERFYGKVAARLDKSTWHTGWNRALARGLAANVGGERFSADPVVIEAYQQAVSDTE